MLIKLEIFKFLLVALHYIPCRGDSVRECNVNSATATCDAGYIEIVNITYGVLKNPRNSCALNSGDDCIIQTYKTCEVRSYNHKKCQLFYSNLTTGSDCTKSQGAKEYVEIGFNCITDVKHGCPAKGITKELHIVNKGFPSETTNPVPTCVCHVNASVDSGVINVNLIEAAGFSQEPFTEFSIINATGHIKKAIDISKRQPGNKKRYLDKSTWAKVILKIDSKINNMYWISLESSSGYDLNYSCFEFQQHSQSTTTSTPTSPIITDRKIPSDGREPTPFQTKAITTPLGTERMTTEVDNNKPTNVALANPPQGILAGTIQIGIVLGAAIFTTVIVGIVVLVILCRRKKRLGSKSPNRESEHNVYMNDAFEYDKNNEKDIKRIAPSTQHKTKSVTDPTYDDQKDGDETKEIRNDSNPEIMDDYSTVENLQTGDSQKSQPVNHSAVYNNEQFHLYANTLSREKPKLLPKPDINSVLHTEIWGNEGACCKGTY
ncbi:unnamed protein product [Owenia fusiformis]|uniref:Uncharacterized protein n=1 Tax=Owenia fusiformis TaxID=6347 RepID=A0A8J1TCG2_OWEFU|nr:unnamed protein product [Owenia fusiformis]